uniref:Lysophospholipid acyltransferase 5 n=1 Tax=Timema tahoe TaxID=61484 RepID=A0A7R9III4_9NEOP|nr:unnamed protein product [Timema tahoe]
MAENVADDVFVNDSKLFESSHLGNIANYLGATEPALRLLLSILIGYPLTLIHRFTLYGKSTLHQHIFFIVSGLSIGYFNYGWEVLHSMASILVTYTVLFTMGGSLISVAITFIFSMTYLLAGYYATGTETYDIKWTMPQCVLTLRLIGLAFDLYDGKKPAELLSNDQKKAALSKIPSLLEVAGHTYFPSSFLVGPQFSMRRYQDFVSGEFREKVCVILLISEMLPPCLIPGIKRGALGFIYLGIYQVGISYCPDAYLLSPIYDMLPFVKKCLVLGFWGKMTLYKYISCWLISEGVCICSGMSDLFQNLFRYVYKRLKFMGNRYISQAAALMFLAVWHGLHSGYYMCFAMEFLVMKLEKDVSFV